MARQQLDKFLLRHGRRWSEGSKWTVKHWKWIQLQAFAEEASRRVLADYLHTVEQASARVKRLTADIGELVERWTLGPLVRALQALRGVDLVTAVVLFGSQQFCTRPASGLISRARVKPSFVQNRCYAERAWDRRVREFCAAHEIRYQGFSLLTANRDVMAHPELNTIARRHDRTVSQIIFRFALAAGILPLTGTTDAEHMQADLEVFDFELVRDEIERIETLVAI